MPVAEPQPLNVRFFSARTLLRLPLLTKTEPLTSTSRDPEPFSVALPIALMMPLFEPPETTRRDDPERRHTDLKSTLDRFHTKLRENLDGLNTATPAPGIDRNHGQRKTL